MNTQKTVFDDVDFIAAHDIRRNAATLRSEQAAIIFKGLFRLIGRFYDRLAAHGALLNVPGRASRGLF
ncbi:MAG: hypothetical protein HQ514_03950 [Rhodospirillales bacterium]|nr:hypothetical protein [Rhodospirillales bacterium]